MKKRSLFTNDFGYVLPYVLFIAAIAIAWISTSIIKYERELDATYTLLQHIENETIIQMATAQFKADAPYKSQENGEVIYTFPNGEAAISYSKIEDDVYSLIFHNVTKNDIELSAQSLVLVRHLE